jgi:hypothetical protein
MVSGLISRRPWLAFTDKLEDANFVWTQLKQLTYFKKQEGKEVVGRTEEIGTQQLKGPCY